MRGMRLCEASWRSACCPLGSSSRAVPPDEHLPSRPAAELPPRRRSRKPPRGPAIGLNSDTPGTQLRTGRLPRPPPSRGLETDHVASRRRSGAVQRSAPPAEASEAPPAKPSLRDLCRVKKPEEEPMIDEARRRLQETVCGANLWFDGLFGERIDVANARGGIGLARRLGPLLAGRGQSAQAAAASPLRPAESGESGGPLPRARRRTRADRGSRRGDGGALVDLRPRVAGRLARRSRLGASGEAGKPVRRAGRRALELRPQGLRPGPLPPGLPGGREVGDPIPRDGLLGEPRGRLRDHHQPRLRAPDEPAAAACAGTTSPPSPRPPRGRAGAPVSSSTRVSSTAAPCSTGLRARRDGGRRALAGVRDAGGLPHADRPPVALRQLHRSATAGRASSSRTIAPAALWSASGSRCSSARTPTEATPMHPQREPGPRHAPDGQPGGGRRPSRARVARPPAAARRARAGGARSR